MGYLRTLQNLSGLTLGQNLAYSFVPLFVGILEEAWGPRSSGCNSSRYVHAFRIKQAFVAYGFAICGDMDILDLGQLVIFLG